MNGMQNQNGGPKFDQNTMNQIQQAANSLQHKDDTREKRLIERRLCYGDLITD